MKRIILASLIAALTGVQPRGAAAETEHEAYIRSAIPKVKAKSERYLRMAAKKFGQEDMLVQQMVGVTGLHRDATAHTCAILSVLLGKGDLMDDDTRMKDPGLNAKDHGDIAEYGVSLGNWVGSAEHLLSLSQAERAREWNIDCVGQFGIGREHALFRDGEGQRLEIDTLFRIDADNRAYLHVLGDIEAGFAEKLGQMLDANPNVEIVALGSGGGSLGEAMKAGRLIRARKLDTQLYNKCESSCAWVFLGGVERMLLRPVQPIGFHQLSSRDGTPYPPGHEVYQLLRDYIVEMGGNADKTMELVLGTPPDKVMFGDPCDTGMATFVQGGC